MSDEQVLRDVLDDLLREHLYSFVRRAFETLHHNQSFIPTGHVEAICWHLQRVAEGRIRRLLITMPPRYLKTICTSVGFAAWMLGRDPTLKIMVASYGHDLAAKHARDFRTVVEAPWFRRVFPRLRPNPKRNTESEFMTTAMGVRKAVSLGGAVTGHGADILIIDDLMKAEDARSDAERQRVKEFYEQTLFSRLNDKQNGAIIAIQQRLHEDDLAGYLLAKGTFTHLELKAIAEEDEEHALGNGRVYTRRKGDALFPAHEPLATLAEMRKDIGSVAFSAQYQQNPVPPDGNRLRWEWFGTYDERPPRPFFQKVVQSWDTAVTAEPTSDFSACTTWGYREGKWYLLDAYRARLEYPDLKRKVIALRDHWQADSVLVEKANTGFPLCQEFRNERLGRLELCAPRDDKETRFAVQTAKIESGMVLLPREADWLPAFKRELLGFPNGRHDDQVDSMTQFLDWIGGRRGRAKCGLSGGRPADVERPLDMARPPAPIRPQGFRRPP
jgi:predicted phage terminase large subunit-like protein